MPEYNSTSSNIGVSWWSHAIGGFKEGIEENLKENIINEPTVKNIFAGDSRTVMMYFATHTEDTVSRLEIDELDSIGNYWKAKGATDYTYMVDEAFPEIDNRVENGTNIFILFGVNNDNNLAMVDKYADILSIKSLEWKNKGAKVFYVTVGPVGENAWHTETLGYRNIWVEEWNNLIKEKLDFSNMVLIDLYEDIGKDLELLNDDIHYTHKASKKIYEYLLENSKDYN